MTRHLALLAGTVVLFGVACSPTEQPGSSEAVTWNDVRSSWGDRRDYTSDSGEGREAWSFYASSTGSGTATSSFDCWAGTVVSYDRGLTSHGMPFTEHTDPEKATGEPELTPAGNNFVSLGIGGEIVLEFASAIVDGPGDDIYVWDTSPAGGHTCPGYPEEADAYGSQDGTTWTLLGGGCQDFSVDMAPHFEWVRYVKIVDTTDPTAFVESMNGYDLDGITATCGDSCPEWLDTLTLGVSIEYSNHRGFAGTMPIYYIGDTMMADIEICNPSTDTIDNLTVTTIEERLGSGTPLACGSPVSQWTGISIAPGDCIVLSYSFLLASGCPWGNYQTHIVVTRDADFGCPTAVQIFNDEAVGIYDPPAGG